MIPCVCVCLLLGKEKQFPAQLEKSQSTSAKETIMTMVLGQTANFNSLSLALNINCFSNTKLTSTSNQVEKLQAIFNKKTVGYYYCKER